MKILKCLSELNIVPVKQNIGNNSFEVIIDYAEDQLKITGENIDDNKSKEVSFCYLHHCIILRKSNCTLRNITDILDTIFKNDDLPRCKKCGSRPAEYHEYKYCSKEIETYESFLPILEVFSFINQIEGKDKPSSFIIAECNCGHQWKLGNALSIFDISSNFQRTNI